jgi:hypothetical protein
MTHYISIIEAKVAGLGINGGKRVRAAAAASYEAAEFSIGASLARGEIGRGATVNVTEATWNAVLAGEADEAVLTVLLNLYA